MINNLKPKAYCLQSKTYCLLQHFKHMKRMNMKTPRSTVALAVLLLLFACNSQAKSSATQQLDPQAAEFKMPDIPRVIVDPDLRMEYLLQHYWDNLRFADTLWIGNEHIEQAFVDYIALFNFAEDKLVKPSLSALANRSLEEPRVFEWFSEKFDQYLYYANSPMRNEEQYALWLDVVMNNAQVAEAYQSRYRYQLERINKNRLGTVAANFSYTDANGQRGQLHQIQSPYVLLYFYDPDCPDCEQARQQLKSSPTISEMLKTKQLTILAMYTNGEIQHWKKHAKEMPADWITGHDASENLVVDKQLYAIRAIPSFYLLDEQKKVLLRDAPVETILKAFAP